jgi:hypothetical protein
MRGADAAAARGRRVPFQAPFLTERPVGIGSLANANGTENRSEVPDLAGIFHWHRQRWRITPTTEH